MKYLLLTVQHKTLRIKSAETSWALSFPNHELVCVQRRALSFQPEMPTSPLTVRSGSAGPICRLHQPAATQSGPRPTRRINAHILNWVRERERGLSLWDLAQPTCHIPSHNAALSTTAQQPWQGAEKKSWRRTDAILVHLTLMRPPKRPLHYIRAFSIYFWSIAASVFTGYEAFVTRDTVAEWLLNIRSLADDTVCKLWQARCNIQPSKHYRHQRGA